MKKSIILDNIGFFEPIAEHRKTLYSEYRIPRKSIHHMDSYEIQRMAVATIAKNLINRLISENVIKIKHHYSVVDDSMVYSGYLDVLLPDENKQSNL